jgi:hypothetical protein
MPVVKNPVLPTEHFNRHWDRDRYDNFRTVIHRYKEWIDDAFDEVDHDASLRKWRRVFNEAFAEGEVLEKATHLSGRRMIQEVASYGANAIAAFHRLLMLPHVQLPPWRMAPRQLTITVSATEHAAKQGQRIRDLVSGDIIGKHRWIRFEACVPSGLPPGFKVHWQVTNTGDEAKGNVRGGFYPSDQDRLIRWEHTQYTGVHWTRAFVENQRTDQCCGQSEPFFVTVQ